MEKDNLTGEALGDLGITDSADPAAVSAAVVQLKKDHKNATDELIEMKAAEKERAKKAAEELVASAIREGRITADKRTEWLEFAAEKPDMAKASLEAIPAKVSLSKQISAIQTDGTIPADRASWKHIDWLKNDPEGLAKIKAEQPDIFEAIRKVR